MASIKTSHLALNNASETDEAGQMKDRENQKQTTGSIPGSPFRKPPRADSWMVKDKLSKEFRAVDDQDELGNLIGDAGEKLLALVDDIRKIDKLDNKELHIPQLVVVGGTSSGKSSVLQALTRLPFPVAKKLCTWFVTETTIRRCRHSEKPGYTIEVIMDKSFGSGDPPFEPRAFDSNEWIDVYQNLKHDIAEAFDLMTPKEKPSPESPDLSRHRLQIDVRKPNQAHFSIVDIPGLVSSVPKADVILSKQLIVNYIENTEAIVLAVSPANSALENQTVFELVCDYNARDRTIGVITKCDTDEKNEENILDILRNRIDSRYYLKLGWFAVRNRSSKEVEDEATFEERDRKEIELFESGIWKDAAISSSYAKSIDPNVLGIKHLKRTLQQSLYKRVKKNFPSLKATMRDLKRDHEKQLLRMGDPRDNPPSQRVFLSGIQERYEEEIKRSLNGDYRSGLDTDHESRLRHHIKKFNDAFESEIEQKALKYAWQLLDQDALETTPEDGTPRAGIFRWIQRRWDYHLGSELRLDVPHELKKKLYQEQTDSWATRATVYLQKVEDAIKACNTDVFNVACKDSTLRTKIREILEPLEIQAFENAQAELQNILRDCDYTDSWHPLFMLDLEEFKNVRVARSVSQVSKPGGPEQPTMPTGLLERQISLYQDFYNDKMRVYEVHDWLLAYWKAAFPRFVDNVIIQVVERHLLGRNGPLKLFNRNWINNLVDSDLENLAGEDEKTTNDRKALKERLEGLEEALRKADIALR